MNPCFELLDRAVIDGRADDLVLSDPPTTHARLLEDVAAVAGVLRAVGVTPGAGVTVRTGDDAVAVAALLATLRLGAVPDAGAEVVVEDREGAPHLVWADDTALDWPAVLKAGRTDPAGAYETDPGDRAARPDLRGLATPLTAARLRDRVVDV